MNDITQMLLQSTTKMMKEFCTKEVINEAEQGIWANELWNILAESEMIMAGVPEENGGIGCTYQDAFSILKVAGKHSAPIPLAETMIANWILSDLGQQVTNEPITFSIPKQDCEIEMKQTSKGWVLNGRVNSVPWARFAKKILVLGNTEEQYVLATIDMNLSRIEFGQNLAGEARDHVIFEEVLIEDCPVIPINYHEVKKKLRYSGAVARTIMISGALENLLEMTVHYTKERSQFGSPIHRFQAIQHQLSLLAGETVAVSTVANYSANAYQEGNYSKEIALAKIRANAAAGYAASIAHQIHAAIGFTYEHILHQTTRRLWSWRDEYGSESEWGEILVEELMDIHRNGLWPFLTVNNANNNLRELKI